MPARRWISWWWLIAIVLLVAQADAEQPLIPRSVLFGNPDKAAPQLSPDGKLLAFLAARDGVLNVWLAPVDDLAAAKPITDDRRRGIRNYLWTYDSRFIAYIQDKDGDENWHIYVVDVQSEQTRDLTPLAGVQARFQHVSPQHPDDLLVAINGKPIRTVYSIHEVLKQCEGKPVELTYMRDGRQHSVMLQPSLSDQGGAGPRWMIGVELAPRVTFTRLGPIEALRESLRQNARGATLIYQFLQSIVERRSSASPLEGPIRIAQLSGEAAREGAPAFINLMATVSLNLAIFNLLPIPILDGGVILLLLIEMLIRRDLSLSFKEAVFKLGFVFLMMVVVFVLYNDITKLLPG